jgi:hypothetical protein
MAPAQTMGTFTLPAMVLVVPCADTVRDHAGKAMAESSAVSRTPASITRPATPCARHDSASNSPNIPSVLADVVETTSTSPGWTTAIAA